jgi:4-phosphopantoate--beta-alanine ligase|tara:strand:+ start:851 stop:1654 length:804 start_codon:yes stop_codon:yes gene_type:complete
LTHASDPSHPRYKSLLARGRLEEAAEAGMLAASALIAHGRGEAFDYLLGEVTTKSAAKATKEAAARLAAAKRGVISFNGNTMALASDDLLRCAALAGADVEINIFYRTPERMLALMSFLENAKNRILNPTPQGINDDDWRKMVDGVRLLGALPDGRIPGLEGPRANCHSDGILAADVLVVPLEDGDRCEALVAMGGDVIVIDLNPMSRSAKMATVTVVDEISRFATNLFQELKNPGLVDKNWDNLDILQSALDCINDNLKKTENVGF